MFYIACTVKMTIRLTLVAMVALITSWDTVQGELAVGLRLLAQLTK
jgi:hypothetical protein